MLLVLVLLFLVGLALSADCPSPPGRGERHPVLKPAPHTPGGSARFAEERPRAHVEENEDPSSSPPVTAPLRPPSVPHAFGRAALPPAEPSLAPLIYALCTLRI